MLARALLGLGMLALVAGAWLATARFVADGARPELSLAWIDVSASVRRTRDAADAHATRVALELARSAAASGREFGLVTSGRDVTVRWPPGSADDALRALSAGEVDFARAARSLEGGDDASALASAADTVARLFDEHGGGELVIVSDGRSTDGDCASTLARLAEAGVAITFARLAPETRFDAALVGLVTSDTVEPGAELVVRAELEFTGPSARAADGEPGATTLVVQVDDPRGSRTVKRRVDPTAAAPSADGGARAFALAIACGPATPGTIRLSAWFEHATPDAVAENDWAETTVECGSELRVLVVGEAPWLGALAGPSATAAIAGIAFESCPPERVADRLGAADLVLAADADLRGLPPVLADFVRFGGGLVVVPGERSLASWLARGPVTSLLPLKLDRDDPRPRALVVLLDASGSMSGESDRAAREAALELARCAAEDERVAVRFFTDALGPEYALGAREAAARRAELEALLAARTPSGSTAIVGALETLADERARQPANSNASTSERCLVFLVSDGRDEVGADEPAARRVRAALAATGVELVVCALGSLAATPLLDALLLPGESTIHVERADELARVFARESSERRYVVEGRVSAVVRGANEFTSLGASEYEARIVAGLPTEVSALSRKARARVAPLAKSIVLDGGGAPLVALARVGLGASLALGAAPDASWCESPASWRDFVFAAIRELARAARVHTATAPRARFFDAASVGFAGSGGRGGATELELSNVPAAWPAELVARLEPLPRAQGGPSRAASERSTEFGPDATSPTARGALEPARTLRLFPSDGRDGTDPRTVRRGTLDGAASLARGVYKLRVLARGETVWMGAVAFEPRSEFAPGAVAWPPAWPTPRSAGSTTPDVGLVNVRASSGGRQLGPHPWAWAAFAAGGLLVFAGAALRLAGRG